MGPKTESSLRPHISQALMDSASSLRSSDFNAPFVVQTDAANPRLGVVLLQEHDGVYGPVSFANRSLTLAGENHRTSEKECLAAISSRCGRIYHGTWERDQPLAANNDHGALGGTLIVAPL